MHWNNWFLDILLMYIFDRNGTAIPQMPFIEQNVFVFCT